MSLHTYPPAAVLADYARAGAGLAILGVPLATVDAAPAVTALLAVGAGVFVLHAVRTIRLHRLRIRMDGDGVGRLSPRPCSIPWRELRVLRLAYYSTRRDRGDGWLHLTLAGPHGRLAVDSRLEGFDVLAARAAAAAIDNGLPLDPATAANLSALGAPAGAVHGAAAQVRR